MQSIKNILKKYLNKKPLLKKQLFINELIEFLKKELKEAGSEIEKIYYKEGKIFLFTPNIFLKNELQLKKGKILNKLNKKFNNKVKDLIIKIC